MINAIVSPNIHPRVLLILVLVAGVVALIGRHGSIDTEEKTRATGAWLILGLCLAIALGTDLVALAFRAWPGERRAFATTVLAFRDDGKGTPCPRTVTFLDPVAGTTGSYCTAHPLETYRAGEPVVVERRANVFGFRYGLHADHARP